MIRDEVYLRHILDAIGEAVKLLSTTSREAEPDIPWREVAGMSDRLIHGYASVPGTSAGGRRPSFCASLV